MLSKFARKQFIVVIFSILVVFVIGAVTLWANSKEEAPPYESLDGILVRIPVFIIPEGEGRGVRFDREKGIFQPVESMDESIMEGMVWGDELSNTLEWLIDDCSKIVVSIPRYIITAEEAFLLGLPIFEGIFEGDNFVDYLNQHLRQTIHQDVQDDQDTP